MSVYVRSSLIIVSLALLASSAAQAAIIVTSASSAAEATYDSLVSATDLINAGQPSFVSASNDAAPTAGPAAATNDGSSTAGSLGDKVWWRLGNVAPDVPTVTLTYSLNTNPLTGGSALGYDITGATVFQSWANADMFCGQNWTMRVTTVANPVFTDAASVYYDPPDTDMSSMVSVADSTGKIASGVTGVQFYFQRIIVNDVLIGEIDVAGTPTVPEPSTIALLGIAALGGLVATRRRKK